MIHDQIKYMPRLLELFEYWDSKRAGRRWPSRSEIDPGEMRFALGNIDLVEIERDPMVFRFRLSGSNIDRDEGFNMQGKTVDEYPLPQHRESIRNTFMQVLADGEVNFEEIERANEGKSVRYGRLILPLSTDGATIDMLLLGRYPINASRIQPGLGR